MAEREIISSPTEVRARLPIGRNALNGAHGRVLVKSGNLHIERKEAERAIRGSWWELPLHISMAATDVIWGGTQLIRAYREQRVSPDNVPHGDGEAAILENGLWGFEEMLHPAGNWLKQVDRKPVYAPLPHGYNRETEDERGEILMEETYKQVKETGKKADWGCLSKGNFSAFWAIAHYPKDVPNLVENIVFAGIPIGCEINQAVGRIYLWTQALNRRSLGKDDFDIFSQEPADSEVRIPDGVGFAVVESRNNGISRFEEGRYEGTLFVDGPHSGLFSNPKVWWIMAYVYAGYEVTQEEVDALKV